jgi:hypothetical protein
MLADTVRNVVPTSCNDLVCRLLCAEQSSHCPCRTCPAHTALEQAVQSRCSQLYVVKTCLLCALPRSCLEKWSAAFSCACKSVAVVVQLGCTCPPQSVSVLAAWQTCAFLLHAAACGCVLPVKRDGLGCVHTYTLVFQS